MSARPSNWRALRAKVHRIHFQERAEARLVRRGPELRDVRPPGNEVLPRVRLGRLFAGSVPVLAVLAAASYVRHGVDPALLEPGQTRGPEGRVEGDAVSPVALEQGRVRAVECDAAWVDDGERYHRAVVARHL